MPKMIEISDLHFGYPAETGEVVPVLNGLNLSIEEGSFVAVLGRNGCGKSTLAKHCNAILLPTCGTVYADGIDTKDFENLLTIRRTVGMVFQNPDNQIVANVVEEDVAFAAENLGVPNAEIRARVDRALELVGMSEYALHAPHLLSGGQKQRIAIAGVFAMNPKCIVLDEPTAMLDPIGRREVVATIKKLNQAYGTTVLLITHHMDEAWKADRLIIMDAGKIIADGTPSEIFPQVDLLHSIGLTVPDTTQLLYALNQAGYKAPLTAFSDEDCAQVLFDLIQSQ